MKPINVERHRFVDLLIFFQRVHPVILRQGVPAALADGIVGGVADAQNVDPQIFQPVTELVKMQGKMGGK